MYEKQMGRVSVACLGLLLSASSGACSSSDAAAGAGGSSGSTPATSGRSGVSMAASGAGAGGGITSNEEGKCDNVLVDSLAYYDYGFTTLALAADAGKPYLLMHGEDAIIVLTAEGDKLKEVARAVEGPSEADITLSSLLVDDSGYYFDVHRQPRKVLVGVPRAGGDPVTVAELMKSTEWYDRPFVWDDSALYLIGPAADESVLRVPRTAEPKAALQDSSSSYIGTLSSLGVTDNGVYVVSASGAGIIVSEHAKEPTDSPTHKSASFRHAMCDTFITPAHVFTSRNALFVACALAGSGTAIFRIPDSSTWPSDFSVDTELTPLVTGRIDRDVEVVVGSDLYYADEATDLIMKVPVAGGTPSAFLRTRSADHLASDGTTLFVDSSCGLQKKAL